MKCYMIEKVCPDSGKEHPCENEGTVPYYGAKICWNCALTHIREETAPKNTLLYVALQLTKRAKDHDP